jgi:hypothetical protein
MLSEGCLGSVASLAALNGAHVLFVNLVGTPPLELSSFDLSGVDVVPEPFLAILIGMVSTERAEMR